MQSVENGVLLPPNTIVGTCGTRSLFGCLISGCDPCDNSPIRCQGQKEDIADHLHALKLICNELPDSIAEFFWIQAARQFAIDSKILMRDAVFPVEMGDMQFCIAAPDQEEIAGIRAICVNGVCTSMGTGDTCAAPWGHVQYRFGKGGSVVFRTPISCKGTARITYYAKPKLSACQIDTSLSGFGEAVTSLAAARLLAQPSKPWSGAGAVKYYEKVYTEILGQAKLQQEFAGSHPQYMLEHGDQCSDSAFVARNPY